ncbi:MAG: aminopeptidase, partial [Chthoniobacterales bacterium]
MTTKAPHPLRRVGFSALRIGLAVVAILSLIFWIGMRMQGKNPSRAASLNEPEIALRAALTADVEKLAGDIGERNMNHYPQLVAAADFIEASLTSAGLTPRRDSYELHGRALHNIEVEIRGAGS